MPMRRAISSAGKPEARRCALRRLPMSSKRMAMSFGSIMPVNPSLNAEPRPRMDNEKPDTPTRHRRVVGESVKRIEDRPLLRGEARFAADIDFPRQLHMRIVRSTVAHGDLVSIDAADALVMEGVVAVWTR